MGNALSKDSPGEHLGLARSEPLFQERRGSRGDFLEGKGQDLKQGREFGGSGAHGSRRVYEADGIRVCPSLLSSIPPPTPSSASLSLWPPLSFMSIKTSHALGKASDISHLNGRVNLRPG